MLFLGNMNIFPDYQNTLQATGCPVIHVDDATFWNFFKIEGDNREKIISQQMFNLCKRVRDKKSNLWDRWQCCGENNCQVRQCQLQTRLSRMYQPLKTVGKTFTVVLL